MKRLSETEIKNLLSLQPLFEDLTNIFPDYPFLNVLSSPHGQQLLNEICTRRVYAPGEIILRENDLGDTLYIILSGHVAIVKGDLSTPTLLGVRSHGAIVGEMALLEHRTRSASVIAIDESELLATDLAGFQRLLNEPPFAGINLLEMLSARLRASDEILAQGTLRQRQLSSQVTNLESEKQHLMEMQRLREEMSDLLVHDLRNPLTAIYMAAKALEIQLPVEIIQENQTLISILFSNVKRMQRLIASMLEVARMEAGETTLSFSDVDLKALVEAQVQNLITLPKQQIQIKTCFAEGLPRVKADRDLIERVLSNLLDNAIKHTPPEGQVTVCGELRRDKVLLSVNDTGPGIPVEERKRLFERFAQVSGEKTKRRGFGLGLVYCRLTVEAHGGEIWVETGEKDSGCRFVFTLPLIPVSKGSAHDG